MFSEIIALQFITSFLPNVLLYVEIMANSWDARLITQKALDFIFAQEGSDDEGIIDGEKEELCQVIKVNLKMNYKTPMVSLKYQDH